MESITVPHLFLFIAVVLLALEAFRLRPAPFAYGWLGLLFYVSIGLIAWGWIAFCACLVLIALLVLLLR